MYEELKAEVERMGVGRVYTMTTKIVCPLYTKMFD